MKMNPKQQAVLDFEGPALYVEAIPGSGKTAVLTRLIANRLLSGAVHWKELIGVTFTRYAAHEMRERVKKILRSEGDGQHFPVRIGTFHSLCYQLVTENWQVLGFTGPDVLIYDSNTQREIVKELIFTSSQRNVPQKIVLAAIRRLGTHFDLGDEFPDVKDLVSRYLRTLREHNAVDYSIVAYMTHKMMGEQQVTISEIYCDEAQDLDAGQHKTFQDMKPSRIVFVGDPEQSIYGFRGGGQPVPAAWECERIVLHTNYRSEQVILDASTRLIEHNEGVSKPMQSHVETPSQFSCVKVIELEDLQRRLRILYNSDGGTIAVLGRTNLIIEELAEVLSGSCLEHEEIPITLVGKREQLLQRPEIRRFIAWLVFPVVTNNPSIFEAVASSAGWSRVRIEKARYEAKSGGTNFFDKFLSWAPSAFSDAYCELQFEALLERMTYLNKMLRQAGSGALNMSDARDLRRMTSQFIRSTPYKERTAVNLMAWLSLHDGQDDLIEDADSAQTIKLMTAHAAKGLEFDNVFIVGLGQGVFPHSMALREGNLFEERRLMFVAMTRARRRLYLVPCDGREPSQFIDEALSDEHI